MPNPGELKEACEAIEAPARRAAARQASIDRQRAENEDLARYEDGRFTLADLKAKYGEKWGIGTDEPEPQRVTADKVFRRYTDDELRKMYGKS